MFPRMERAKKGEIVDDFRKIALIEHTTEDAIREGVSKGVITLCNSGVRKIDPVAIGEGLRIKVNANIGTSSDASSVSEEVEKALYSIEDVIEAVVTGVPDDILGEAVKAFVVLKDGSELSEKAIIAHYSRNLEDFMVPKFVELRESLPRTTTGKITTKNL